MPSRGKYTAELWGMSGHFLLFSYWPVSICKEVCKHRTSVLNIKGESSVQKSIIEFHHSKVTLSV